jgi:hypothetical protein
MLLCELCTDYDKPQEQIEILYCNDISNCEHLTEESSQSLQVFMVVILMKAAENCMAGETGY